MSEQTKKGVFLVRLLHTLAVALFLVNYTAQISGVIAWSWWWVTAPLWIAFLIWLVLFLVICGTAVAAATIPALINRGKR